MTRVHSPSSASFSQGNFSFTRHRDSGSLMFVTIAGTTPSIFDARLPPFAFPLVSVSIDLSCRPLKRILTM